MYLTNSCSRHSFILTSLTAAVKMGETEERVRAHDKYIVLSYLFSQLYSPTLFCSFLVSFTSLVHHCQSLPFSASVISLIQPRLASSLYYCYLSLSSPSL